MPKRKVEQADSAEEEEQWEPKTAAKPAEDDEDDEDSGDESSKPEKKKPKAKKKVAKKPGDGSGVSNKIELGNKKFVDVRAFKSHILIDIREYYENSEGEMKPGKKGIALNPLQWKALKEKMDDISAKVEELQ